MQDLYKRIPGAAIYIIALIGGLYLRQPYWLTVCALLLLVATYEWGRLQLIQKPNQVWITSGIIIYIFLHFSLFLAKAAVGPIWINICIISTALFYLFCVLVFQSSVFKRKYIIGSFLYILPPFIFLYLLGLEIPPTYLILLFTIIWTADTCAYIGGRLYGQRKLSPSISPGKTWEGAITGVLCAGIIAFIAAHYILKIEESKIWFSIGVLVAIFGITGDLFESKIKRRHNIKDSGTLLPGHGGILDRMDSLLFALPLYYICVTILNI